MVAVNRPLRPALQRLQFSAKYLSLCPVEELACKLRAVLPARKTQDVNRDPGAEDKFKEIGQAYEVRKQ